MTEITFERHFCKKPIQFPQQHYSTIFYLPCVRRLTNTVHPPQAHISEYLIAQAWQEFLDSKRRGQQQEIKGKWSNHCSQVYRVGSIGRKYFWEQLLNVSDRVSGSWTPQDSSSSTAFLCPGMFSLRENTSRLGLLPSFAHPRKQKYTRDMVFFLLLYYCKRLFLALSYWLWEF